MIRQILKWRGVNPDTGKANPPLYSNPIQRMLKS